MADAAAMVKAYTTGVQQGGQKYAARVAATTKDQNALAIAAVQSGKWLQKVTAAAPRMLAGLQASSTAAWKAAVAATGSAAYSASATKAAAKYGKVAPALASAANNAQAAVAAQSAPLERVRAAANAMKTAFGKTDLL